MAGPGKLIGVCLSQAHTFLKTDFLVELDMQARKEGYSIVVFNSSMDYYWAQAGNNTTGCVYSLIRYELLAALVILANPAGDHFEEVFRDGGEEWTYLADRGADGYLGVWIPQ